MNAEEKLALAGFLDLASGYTKDGYKRTQTDYNFEDEKPVPQSAEKKTAIPLAYMIEEEDEEANFTASLNGDTTENTGVIAQAVSVCKACALAATRKNTVPGEGVLNPLVMVIGEGPGADEDAAGRPFVGKAGQLLDKMLSSIGLFRNKNCFIANMVKCRPPGNRDPAPDELKACYPFLERQILFLKPAIILCAGRIAAQNLLKTSTGINALRGKFAEFKINESERKDQGALRIPVLPTFHPSALLRDDTLRRPAWEDLKLLRERLAVINEEYSSSLKNIEG